MAFVRGFRKIAEGNGFLGGSMVDAAIAAKKNAPKTPPPPPPAPNTGLMGKALGSLRTAFGSSS